jgi:hypothetical protein
MAIAFGLALQACGIKSPPQESCNFVQNSEMQRVSWGIKTPVVLLIDQSVPSAYFDSIKKAAAKWNESVGREIIKIGGWSNTGSRGSVPDGVNLIYFQNNWDGSTSEQARTTIYWSGDRIYEADIKVNERDFAFFPSDVPEAGKLDMESLMIHEFGHVLGLKHITISGSVMQPTLSGATAMNLGAGFRRKLTASDETSIRCEY